MDSDVKPQEQQKNNKKNNFPNITRLKAVIAPAGPTTFNPAKVASLNIGCLGQRFGPDFGVVPVHNYHSEATVNSLET